MNHLQSGGRRGPPHNFDDCYPVLDQEYRDIGLLEITQ